MDPTIRDEIMRLTGNAAMRREELLLTAHKKLRKKKLLSIFSGILALVSAGAITSVLVAAVGDRGMQVWAALSAALSGTISLVTTAYFSDEDIANMFSGSSKYLSLRENVYRLVIHPKITDKARFESLTELQAEYSRLDESYSRFFSMHKSRLTSRPQIVFRDPRVANAGYNELERVKRELEQNAQSIKGTT